MTTDNISVTQAHAPESGPPPAAADGSPAPSASFPANQRLESSYAAGEKPAIEPSTPRVAGEAPQSDQPSAENAPSAYDPSDSSDAQPPEASSGISQGDHAEANQDDYSEAIAPSAPENVDQPSPASSPAAESAQRRVQLKPTYAPEIAKPIPFLGRSSGSDAAGTVASNPVASAASPSSAPVEDVGPAEDAATAQTMTPAEEVARAEQVPPAQEGGSAESGAPVEEGAPAEATEAVPIGEVTQAAAEASTLASHEGTGPETEPQSDGADTAMADEAAAAEAAAAMAQTTSAPPVEPVALPPRDEALDADIEAELNAALSGTSGETAPVEIGDALGEAASSVTADELDVSKGARVSGTVQSIHGDDMFIDFGLRMAGVLSRRQFGLRRQPMQGEAITVIVNRVDENEGLIHVNLPSGATRVRGGWDEVSVDQTVECQVNQINKGGLEVSVGSLRGFMPASQVELGYVADLSAYVGQKLRAQITEVNPKRRKLVLSRRKVLEVEREQTEQDFFEKVAPGQTYEGRVKTIKNYGAFVDIGGVDGLLHVAQISWGRVNHPKDVLTEGQTIEVKVLSVDPEKKKIGLGMRQLSQNPWKSVEEKFSAGAVAKGKVTRIENFGAFIELEPGLEGLVHISELDHKRIKTVGEVLRVGQDVDVQVLEVDPSRKRISLSLKALKEKPEEAPPPEERPPVRRKSSEALKGGIGEPTRGKLFGDPRQFGR